MRKVILASASPRRKELLSLLGVPFTVDVSNFEENILPNETAQETVERLSLGKASLVAKKYSDAIIIAADTIVWYKGRMLGKPKDKKVAKEMLTFLSGSMHEIVTGFTVLDTKTKKHKTASITSQVFAKKISKKEIADYIATGEPMDKAGAYGVQGKGSLFIEKVHGDFWGIVGLPLFALGQTLKEFGVDVF